MDETPADDTTPAPAPEPAVPSSAVPSSAVPSSPWAAPTLPAPAPPPFTSVVITEPPKKSRVGWLIAAAVVVVAAVGVGAFLLTRGDDPVTFSLDAATARMADAPGRSSVIETTALGQTLVLNATVDAETDLAKVSMDLGKIIGSDRTIVAIVDAENKTLYMEAKGFGPSLAELTDKPWVKVDQQALEDAGEDASTFDQLGSAGKIDVDLIVAHAKKITDLGASTFDGEEVRHYEVIAAIADVPGLQDLLESQIQGLDAELPDELTYDVYVTKDNEVRRVVYEMDLTTSKVSVDTTMHLLDTAPGISIPPDRDVVDAQDLG